MQSHAVDAVMSERNVDSDLETRIRAEFAEMPGLRLTLPQASRLFNVEREDCERILGVLVTHGDLLNQGGRFSQATASSRRLI